MNDLINIIGGDEYRISETPILYSQPAESYLHNGFIEEGNSVLESSTSETAMMMNKQVCIRIPGYEIIMNKLHPNDTYCGGTIADHDFNKTAFLYEKEELAEKEISSSNIYKEKSSGTIVSVNSFGGFEQYKHLADIILNAPQDKEYCVYMVEKDPESDTEASVVHFFGVYQLDKISSLYNHKVILCKTKNIFHFK